jgi:hypothetical protein
MPERKVKVKVEKCVIDTEEHIFIVSARYSIVQGIRPREQVATNMREWEVLFTCPGTGRQFKATICLPDAEQEEVEGVGVPV